MEGSPSTGWGLEGRGAVQMKRVGLGVAMVAVAMAAAAAQEFVGEPLVIGAAEPTLAASDPTSVDGVPESSGGDASIVIDEPMAMGESPAPEMMAHEGCRPGCTSCGRSRVVDRDYVVFDVLFLDRDNATNNQPIAVENPNGSRPGATVLTTRSMTPTTAPGVRLFAGRHGCDGLGWEVGYWGVYGWYGDARADAANGLAVPGNLGKGVPRWSSADTIRGAWWSSLNVAELNLLSSDFSSGCEPCSPWPQRRCRHDTELDWIGGLFWAGLDEQAALLVNPFSGGPADRYQVTTSSNLFGAQLGVRGRRTWDRLSLEGFLKAGLGGAWLEQSSPPITSIYGGSHEYRPGRSAIDTGMGFLSTMNLTLAYRFSETWGLRIGYNLAWLSGVALAPNQFDFTDTGTSGTGVRGAGGMFLHGANLGLESRW